MVDLNPSNDEAIATHYAALRAVVEALSATHGAPVAVNYQSGGWVAYATWVSADGATLVWADLAHTVEDSTVESAPLTLLNDDALAALGDNPDADEYNGIFTLWDADAPSHTMGTYTVYTPADDTTRVYGVGDPIA